MSLEVGTRLGSYEIGASIGVGAMGEVYRATDLKLGRSVAVKVLLPEFAEDADRLRRFEQEARAASALNHPNIVHIYDVGEDGGNHFMVMELVEGRNLRQLLRKEPFGIKRVLELSQQMAAGLANAHAAGIVHRDIKPENMMVTADGIVKILDFGLAKLLVAPFESHSEMATLARLGTRHGMLIGTVEYMSPEQASGRTVDHRSDQFSLGLIFYEMVTGRMAFRRETAAQTLASIIEHDPPAIPELNPSCPEALSRVIRRCLNKSSVRRYGETRELLRELESVSATPPMPPVPPIPQNPKPDIAPLTSGLAAVVDRELNEALGEVGRELQDALHEEQTFHLQSSDGKISTLTKKRLRAKLRKNRFSGDELVRRGNDGEWVPLFDSEIFLEEVPVRTNPAEWARKRRVGGFISHATTFVVFVSVWFLMAGELPLWMAYWGIGLALHGLKTLPSVLPRGEGALGAPSPEGSPVLPEAALPDALLSPAFCGEVERVKSLLKQRGGGDAGSLTAEIDQIVDGITELATKRRDLMEQTSDHERDQLAKIIEEAERRLIEATSADDRRLYQRQFEVLRQRQQAIDKALVIVERLGIRRDVAEQQIKQLRLDLSRDEASIASIPELTSKLQDIRHEVDARELVDEEIAHELLS